MSLKKKGYSPRQMRTTIVTSTHDVEALPELTDRVIVVSHGSLLGGGEMHKVLQDVKLLESAGLELPSIARLFTKLQQLGLVNDVPITYEEALNVLQKELSSHQ
jgi:cobalt/nickel transport system ATP-binding protein